MAACVEASFKYGNLNEKERVFKKNQFMFPSNVYQNWTGIVLALMLK